MSQHEEDRLANWCYESPKQAAREILRLRSMHTWLPIETAPKDGTSVLGFIPGRSGYIARQDIVPVHWSGWGGGVWDNSTSGHHLSSDPSHWMPLPLGPGSHV